MTLPGFEEALARIADSRLPVFFTGSHKNSGKTTTFTRIAHELHGRGRDLVLVSLGRDGEARDQFYGHEKPPVSLMPGMRFVTVLPTAPDVAARLLLPLPGFVDGRQLGLFEAISCGETELWGPPAAAELRRVVDAVQPYGLTLVDGALDRQAALYQGESAMVLCCRSDSPNPAALALYLSSRRALFDAPITSADDLPVLDSIEELDPAGADIGGVIIAGPLTQTMAEILLSSGIRRIVVKSPMHVFCDPKTALRLAPVLQVLTRPLWLATAVNPAGSGAMPADLLALAQKALGGHHPVFDPLAL